MCFIKVILHSPSKEQPSLDLTQFQLRLESFRSSVTEGLLCVPEGYTGALVKQDITLSDPWNCLYVFVTPQGS